MIDGLGTGEFQVFRVIETIKILLVLIIFSKISVEKNLFRQSASLLKFP